MDRIKLIICPSPMDGDLSIDGFLERRDLRK